MIPADEPDDKAAALRHGFDRSFAEAPSLDGAAGEPFLAVRIAGAACALRLVEVSGLFAGKTVVAMPSPAAELLGLAECRGAVLPVYDLGLMLGRPKGTAPRWLVVAAGGDVAFAFEGYDGFLRAQPGTIIQESRPEGAAGSVREVLQADVIRPIVHLPSLIETLMNRWTTNRRSG
jgi:purine-binding chemotaxis protein CheW